MKRVTKSKRKELKAIFVDVCHALERVSACEHAARVCNSSPSKYNRCIEMLRDVATKYEIAWRDFSKTLPYSERIPSIHSHW